MKAKALFLLLIMILCLGCMLCLAACNEEEPDPNGDNTENTEGNSEDPHTHTYGNWTVTLYPTCNASGERMRICSSCDYIDKERIFSTDEHLYASDNKCSVCGVERESTPGLTYELILGGAAYAVTGCDSTIEETLTFPYYYNHLPITTIKEGAFSGYSAFTEVVIPDTITTICAEAFKNCTSLANVVYEGNSHLNLIGEQAFAGTALTAFEIPSDVISIGAGAFAECKALAEFTLAEDNVRFLVGDGGYLVDKTEKMLISAGTQGKTPDTVTKIGAYAFSSNMSGQITIPAAVTELHPRALYGCAGVGSVTFKNTAGWYVTEVKGGTTGTAVTVNDPAANVASLTQTYLAFYWYRSDSGT